MNLLFSFPSVSCFSTADTSRFEFAFLLSLGVSAPIHKTNKNSRYTTLKLATCSESCNTLSYKRKNLTISAIFSIYLVWIHLIPQPLWLLLLLAGVPEPPLLPDELPELPEPNHPHKAAADDELEHVNSISFKGIFQLAKYLPIRNYLVIYVYRYFCCMQNNQVFISWATITDMLCRFYELNHKLTFC